MALAERAALVAELRLDDKMSAGLARASRSLDGFAKRAGLSSRNLRTLQTNIIRIGAVAAAGIGAAIGSGLQSLAELEDANTATAEALKVSGLAAEVTAEQVRELSQRLEDYSDAFFDDKAIQRGANTLIRFGNVAEENFEKALTVATDLGVRLGSVEQASSTLALALADPTRATRALRSAGVALTKTEQKKIKAWVESGKIGEAQAFILDKIAAKTEGAAKAAGGPYRDALNKLGDAAEDAKMALGEAFLPVITKVADRLKTALGDEKFRQTLRDFGAGLAKGLDSLIEIASNLPWAQIGQSLQIAGAGAKTLLGAFSSLPPWVQTAVITGWGLNKLTGGALGGIVKELGAGLIKGVLGINAGVVNLKAGTVVGGGSPTGGAPVAGGGARGALGRIGGAIAVVGTVTLAAGTLAALAQTWGDVANQIGEAKQGLREATDRGVPQLSQEATIAAIRNIDEQLANPLNAILLGVSGTREEVDRTRAALVARLTEINRTTGAGDERTGQRIGSLNSAVDKTTMETRRVASAQAIAARMQSVLQSITNARLATIAAKDFSPKITVPVYVSSYVSVRDMAVRQQTRATYTRVGIE